MSNVLSAEFPNNSLSAGAWLWSSSILFQLIIRLDYTLRSFKIKFLSQFMVKILQLFDETNFNTFDSKPNKMELLQSQAPAERELLGNSADRTSDIGV